MFAPVEAILCLGAMFVVNHSSYGGSTSELAPTPVPELAALFRRSCASILAKMANIDGSRRNGGRNERAAASELLSHGAEPFFAAYVIVILAAREEGISQSQLPDFLALENETAWAWLASHEFSSEDVLDAEESRLQELQASDGLGRVVTERLVVGIARVGQDRFANAVLSNYAHSCAFCGLAIPPVLHRRGLLRASHIKPWRASSHAERLDIANGIAACPTHDAAFDGGLLFLDESLRIRASADLAAALVTARSLTREFGSPPLGAYLQLPAGGLAPADHYVTWHRTHLTACR